MAQLASMIRSLEKVARAQQRFISDFQKLLPTMNGITKSGHAQPSARAKRLRCPRCSRKFAQPMNLGRHLQATHRRKGVKKAA